MCARSHRFELVDQETTHPETTERERVCSHTCMCVCVYPLFILIKIRVSRFSHATFPKPDLWPPPRRLRSLRKIIVFSEILRKSATGRKRAQCFICVPLARRRRVWKEGFRFVFFLLSLCMLAFEAAPRASCVCLHWKNLCFFAAAAAATENRWTISPLISLGTSASVSRSVEWEF